MTAVDPEEVVLYDIDTSRSLEDLYADPETRWYAVRILGRGVTAAGDWNPLLHPRGKDGKFINVFGFVRWYDFGSGKFRKGKVTKIDSSGDIHVSPMDSPSETEIFSHTDASKELYAAATVKANVHLPSGTDKTDAWKKTGGQGGSNPGGFYETSADTNAGDLNPTQLSAIIQDAGLWMAETSDEDGQAPQLGYGIYLNGDGSLYYSQDGTNFRLLGSDTPLYADDIELDQPIRYVGSVNKMDEAWDQMAKAHADFAPGQKFYVKKAKSLSHAANEVLANRLYEAAGVPVAETYLDHDGKTIASKLVPSTESKIDLGAALDNAEAMSLVRQDMVVDAWLANWDVVGLGLENVQVVDGVPYRIDAGGALYYRAQGAPKGNLFGPKVGEIDTLRNKSMNAQAAKVFGDATDEELTKGALKVAAVSPDAIAEMVESMDLPVDLADILIARRQDIIDRFELEDPWIEKPVFDADAPSAQALGQSFDSPLPGEDLTFAEAWNIAAKAADAKGIDPESFANDFNERFNASTSGDEGITDPVSLDALNDFMDEHGLNEPDPDAFDKAISMPGGDDDELLEWDDAYAQFVSAAKAKGEDPEGYDFGGYFSSLAIDDADDFEGEGEPPSYIRSSDLDDFLAQNDLTPTIDEVPEPGQVWEENTGPEGVGATGPSYGGKVWAGTFWADGEFLQSPTGYFENVSDTVETGFDLAGDPKTIEVGSYVFFENEVWKFAGPKEGTLTVSKLEATNPYQPPTYDADLVFGVAYVANNETIGSITAAQHKAGLDASVTTYLENPGLLHATLTNPDTYFGGYEPTSASLLTPAMSEVAVVTGPNGQLVDNYTPGTLIYLPWAKKVVRVQSVENGDVLVSDHDGGKPMAVYPPGGDPYVFIGVNEHSRVLMEAVFQAQVPETVDTPASPVDPELIAKMDAHAEAAAKADEMVQDAVPQASEQILLNVEIYDALKSLNVNQTVSDSFLNIFGSGGSMTKEDFQNWLENNEFEGDVDANSVTETIAAFNAPETVDAVPDQPISVWEGVSSKLHVSEKINFSELGSPEEIDAKAEALVGKTIFIQYADPDQQSWDTGDKDYYGDSPSTSGGTQGLFYVESVINGKLQLRTPTGKLTGMATKDGYSQEGQGKWNLYDVTESVDSNDLKAMTNPSFKGNGDIVVNGIVVGEWQKKESYWGSNNGYTYAIYGGFTPGGKMVKGYAAKKSGKGVGLTDYVSMSVIPPKAETTKKKSASAGHQAVKQMISKDIPGDPNLASGEVAKLGDWVKSTKGGGGFVGKIVGWPNQDTHPGLAFAVSEAGEQKIVKLKTQKKVDGPETAGELPNAYEDIKLASGETPKVGQKVKAGAAGSEIEGIINHINPKQGWVYILTPDGKLKSKTYSVTTVVEEPNLIWDPDVEEIVKVAATKGTVKPGKKKGPNGPSYPAPDGSTISQTDAEKAEWLDANPNRKLTKDGFVPAVGMRVRLTGGVEGTVVKTSDSWASNPNALRIWVPSEGKIKTASTSTVEVDHANELFGYKGEKPVTIQGVTGPGGLISMLPGTKVYAVKSNFSYYSHAKHQYRTVPSETYIAIPPNGYATSFYGGGYQGQHVYTQKGELSKILQGKLYNTDTASENIQLIGTVDPDATDAPYLKPKPHKKTSMGGGEVHFDPAHIEFVDGEGNMVDPYEGSESIAEPTLGEKLGDILGIPKSMSDAAAAKEAAQGTETTPDFIEDEPNAPEVEVPVDTDEPVSTANPESELEQGKLIEPGSVPAPKLIPSSNLSALVPPSPPKPVDQSVSDAVIPQATGNTADLSKIPEPMAGTKVKSVAQAASEMIAKKDSTEVGTGTTYALGDSDLVEDMQFRYNVEKVGGEERLVLRFRLREDLAEEVADKMMSQSSGYVGAWKAQGNKYVTEFKPGDAIYVRVGTNQAGTYGDSNLQMLKPPDPKQPPPIAPNARVIGEPVLIGNTGGAEGEFPTYRLKVRTEDGIEGEIDMQMRLEGSVTNFEWDPNAPTPNTSGSKLALTPTAQEAGWQRTGEMSMPGSHGDMTDESGKFGYTPSQTIGKLANGSGGHRFERKEKDGSFLTFNVAHATESGTGYEATRRANASGEVRISVPLNGRSEEEILAIMSKDMELVGLPPQAQEAPSNEAMGMLGLAKLVTNYHPNYEYRGKPLSGPEDPRIQQTLDHMSKELKPHLKRDVTLDDIRFHTHESGRTQVVLSPDVAKAMAKRQKIKFYRHSLSGGDSMVADILGGTHSGLMSTDERWSRGVMTSGLSSASDMRNGPGDRVYVRANTSGSPSSGHFIMNPGVFNMSTETYTKGSYDGWGDRSTTNMFLTKGGDYEYMYKRMLETDQLGLYVTHSQAAADGIISKLKAKGITHIGGIPVEDVVVSQTKANEIVNSPEWLDRGTNLYEGAPTLGDLLATTAAPATTGPA